MKCINHGPAFTYASLTNSPDVRSAPAAVLPNHSPSSLPVSPIRDETIGPGDTRASAGAAQVPLPTLNSHDCLGTDRRRRQRATRLTRLSILSSTRPSEAFGQPNLLPAPPTPPFSPCSRTTLLSWVPSHQQYRSCPCLAVALSSPVVGASPHHQSRWRLPSLLKTFWTS